MVVVDSSVWIDFFAGRPSAGRNTLRRLLHDGEVRIVVPDLVLFEVLRGFRHERDWRHARDLLLSLGVEVVGGQQLMLEAAQHYRSLRAQGVTVRSAVDVLIATFCIDNGYALLHSDRDFEAFQDLRGLQGWRH